MTDPRIAGVIEQYRTATNVGGGAVDAAYYEAAAPALWRRLGPWAPARRSARCLDLACGNGELLFALERHGYQQLQGVDLCLESVELARRFTRAGVEHADVMSHLAAQPDASFDLVTALNIFEHLPKAELPGLFTELRRVVAPGGSVVAMVPNALSPFGASTRYWDITHELAFTPASVHQLARLSGWGERVEFRECGPMPHGLKSSVRWALWQGLRAGVAAWFLIEAGSTRGPVYTADMMFRLVR